MDVFISTNRRYVFKFKKVNRICRIRLRQTLTNAFVTFTDMRDRVVAVISAGSAGIIGSKRRKTAPQTIERIVKAMINKFKVNNIQRAEVFIVNRMKRGNYFLVKGLRKSGVDPSWFRQRFLKAHNGGRAKKLRRT